MKSIEATLLAHKALAVTTRCRLLKIRRKDSAVRGFANLDIDVTFDASDGDGAVLYRSNQSFTPSRIASSEGTGIDNANLRGIIAEFSALGVTEHEVRNGILDGAEAVVYEINYEDLTAGRREFITSGSCGRVSMDGAEFEAEFRGLMQAFRQNTTHVTQTDCRHDYGSAGCGAAFAWSNYTVTGVDGTEPDRIFTASAMTEAADYYTPGVVEALTGQNAGAQMEVAAFASGQVQLLRPLYWPWANGDTFRIRIDCPHTVDGCKDPRRARWPLNYWGEHLLPTGRESELLTPGAG